MVEDEVGRRVVADPDSRARTHLANERTFLAWLRTGLNLIVLGLAVAQFLDPGLVGGLPLAAFFGVALVGSGIILTGLAGTHYRRGRRQIDEGAYRAPDRVVVAAVLLVGAAGVLALGGVVLIGGGG